MDKKQIKERIAIIEQGICLNEPKIVNLKLTKTTATYDAIFYEEDGSQRYNDCSIPIEKILNAWGEKNEISGC